VRALFADLVAARGLGGDAGTRVLYGGCSAGARGALFNADAVRAGLSASAVAANITRFGTLLDSAFYQDIEPYDTALPSLMTIAAAAVQLHGSAAGAMPACAARFSGADIWKCFFGCYTVPFLEAPYFLHQFLYDSYQLDKNGATGTPKGAQVAYDEDFRNLTHTYARLDVDVRPGRDHAASLPACHRHCNTLTGNTWSTNTVQGHTLEAAVASWFFSDASVPNFLEDTCGGFSCGPGCKA